MSAGPPLPTARSASGSPLPREGGGDIARPAAAGPLGVFDSGVGGLSVWREIVRQLPNESTIYVADQAHLPYGPRPADEIARFAGGITQFLLQQGCKAIVVACNTASAVALKRLREALPQVPFVGMEPAVKPAAEATRTRVVGVMATPATFQGRMLALAVERFARDVTLVNQTCPGLVERIEAGRLDDAQTMAMLRDFLAPIVAANADTIVLACSHYPFVADTLRRIVGSAVTVIDPAPAVARQVGRVLAQLGIAAMSGAGASHVWYTTDDTTALARAATCVAPEATPQIRGALWRGDVLEAAAPTGTAA